MKVRLVLKELRSHAESSLGGACGAACAARGSARTETRIAPQMVFSSLVMSFSLSLVRRGSRSPDLAREAAHSYRPGRTIRIGLLRAWPIIQAATIAYNLRGGRNFSACGLPIVGTSRTQRKGAACATPLAAAIGDDTAGVQVQRTACSGEPSDRHRRSVELGERESGKRFAEGSLHILKHADRGGFTKRVGRGGVAAPVDPGHVAALRNVGHHFIQLAAHR